jgi:cation diffusion facilitator family transporter
VSSPLAEGLRVTWLSLAVNVVLAVAKFVTGILAGSAALVADGVHSLVDLVSDIAAILGLRYADLPRDEDHPYGHHRFSTLAALLISSLILAFCAGLAWHSVSSLALGHPAVVPGVAAAWVAGFALVIKETFHRVARRQALRLNSRLLLANAADHRADAIASLMALVAVVTAHLNPALAVLDRVVGLVMAGWLGAEGVRLLRGAVTDLLDTAPAETVLRDLSEHILAVPGVRGFHAFRARRLGDRFEVDFHLQVDPGCSVREGHAIAGKVKADILATHPEVLAILVHVEPDEDANLRSEGHSGRMGV